MDHIHANDCRLEFSVYSQNFTFIYPGYRVYDIVINL